MVVVGAGVIPANSLNLRMTPAQAWLTRRTTVITAAAAGTSALVRRAALGELVSRILR